MKKQVWLMPMVAALLIVAGCGQHSSTKTSSDTSSRTAQSSKTTHKKAVKHSEAASSSKTSAASSTSSSSTATSHSTAATPTGLSALTAELRTKLSGALLPTSVGTTNGTVNASYTGSAANYTVYYTTSGTAGALNSVASSSNAALAVKKTTYSTTAAAAAQVNYQAKASGLPTVSLGHNMTATKEGAAGSTYFTWYEGRWSVVLRASNVNNEDGTSLAKEAVAWLATYSLPIPTGNGAVQLYVSAGTRGNTVTWHVNNVLYQISGTDAMATLRAATSMR